MFTYSLRMCRFVLVGAVALSAAQLVQAQVATTDGTLPTNAAGEGPIYDDELAKLVHTLLPECAKKLLMFTECYGGDFLDEFAGDANTAVTSADEAGDESIYGGYHDDAAKGLKPGAGRTAKDAHDDGVAGKADSESPQTGGGLPLTDFPLDPVGTNGVHSRHVLVYAGKPEAMDDADRDAIKANFAGQPNTTVTTVGAGGAADGYDKPATHKGLEDAIKEIADDINNSDDPCNEQFILFVTDHGDIHETITTPPGSDWNLFPGVNPWGFGLPMPGLSSLQVDPAAWVADPSNVTSFSLSLPIGHIGITTPATPHNFLPPGALILVLNSPRQQVTLQAQSWTYLDVNHDGTVGNFPGEAVTAVFPISEPLMIGAFFDVFYTASVINNTPQVLPANMFRQDSGAIRRLGDGTVCRADFNADGFLDFTDFDAFVGAFEAGMASADFNGDGFLDFTDFDDFVTAFEAGC